MCRCIRVNVKQLLYSRRLKFTRRPTTISRVRFTNRLCFISISCTLHEVQKTLKIYIATYFTPLYCRLNLHTK